MNLLTVCFPVYNEEKYIDGLLQSVVNAPPLDKEIILIDGNSNDDTLAKIKQWQEKYPNIRVITNELRQVSHGFNIAYKNSRSKYIALMGAHSRYPQNYFQIGLSILEKGIADAVGGSLKQVGNTRKGKIIAACMSCKFGVGNAEIRTLKKREYVQSVAMSIYKRQVFEEIGLLDEQLVRNQDDEFHYRMNARGYRILMEPEMEITYFVRNGLLALWKQYYNYGLYKPLVLKKVRSGIRMRHLVPPVFVIYIFTLPALLLVSWLAVLPLAVYVLISFEYSVRIAHNLKDFFLSMATFAVLHISSGLGMLAGLTKLF